MIDSNLKVLLIEDNALVAEDILEELSLRGVSRVSTADSLHEAVRVIGHTMPDVAIVDLTLRDGDTGTQLAVALSRSGVKVYVYSGCATLKHALMSVNHVFVSKPAPADMIADLVIDGASHWASRSKVLN